MLFRLHFRWTIAKLVALRFRSLTLALRFDHCGAGIREVFADHEFRKVVDQLVTLF